jgi:hypothetical protein
MFAKIKPTPGRTSHIDYARNQNVLDAVDYLLNMSSGESACSHGAVSDLDMTVTCLWSSFRRSVGYRNLPIDVPLTCLNLT